MTIITDDQRAAAATLARNLAQTMLRDGGVPMAIDRARAMGWASGDQIGLRLRGLTVLAAGGAQASGVRIAPGERFAIIRGLAVVPVTGILTHNDQMLADWLGWSTYLGLAQTMAELAADQTVTAVALDIDSPGGMVLGLDGAVQAIAALAAIKPVHALANPLAASAAYALASQATDLAMAPGAWVGSIGVVQWTYAAVAPGSDGFQYAEFTSSRARAKRPDPLTEVGRTEILRGLDEIEAVFHAQVAAGRGIPLADLPARLTVTGDVADGGATYLGPDAIARGLADRIVTPAEFYAGLLEGAAPRPAARRSRGALALAAAARAQAAI